tara:strand:- start:239 stop:616 length:378 start_codon:yes stop_codon:yes gene_type:complete
MAVSDIKPGQIAVTETTVTLDLTTNRVGKPGAEVLSTPSLLALMEQCCIEASDSQLAPKHTTVGYAVDGMRHMAPTPIGQVVTVKAELTEVIRNRLTYSIEAYEGDKQIGVAIHKRAIIPKDSDD